MAYSIGPKFNNAIDAANLANIYLEGDKVIDERNRKDFDNMMTGLKGIGQGIGKARQWNEADRIGDTLKNKLDAVMNKRSEAYKTLLDLKQQIEAAKNKVSGINNMLPKSEPFGAYSYRNDLDQDPATYYPYANWQKRLYQDVMDEKAQEARAAGRKAGL